MKRDLRRISDLGREQIEGLLARAFRFKTLKGLGVRREQDLDGRVVAMIFEKPSLRTKVSFEVATSYLSGTPVFLTSEQILASGGNEQGRESVVDIAKNLERMADIIVARVYSHRTIEIMAESVQIPVINALCDQHHPCQALADLMAIKWHLGDRDQVNDCRDLVGKTLCFIGDGNNVATSLMQAAVTVGINVTIASPPGYEVPAAEIAFAKERAAASGAAIRLESDPERAIGGADVVYTDTFVSMGQEREKVKRMSDFANYQVNAALMSRAAPSAIFLHCLPAHRGEEVTDGVMDGPQSKVFDQAECRLHVAKALLSYYASSQISPDLC
jgi:ornithine carbamoyltransferase